MESINWKDEGMKDGEVKINKTEQINNTRQTSKHGQMHGVVWGDGPRRGTNQPRRAASGSGSKHRSGMTHVVAV
jgi:hypothetical protein